MARKINTFPILKSHTMYGTAGTTKDSNPIDLRDVSAQGDFSLSYTVSTAGTASTCGTTTFSYLGCSVFDGTYIAPTDGTFGTVDENGGSGILSFSPPVMPFMKIRVAVGTSGTSLVTAALHVR